MNKIPNIAIAGKTNTGKSTLFNRLISGPKAISSPTEATTRDSNEGFCKHDGKIFKLVDTAGLMMKPRTVLENKVNEKIYNCMVEADLIILLADGKGSPTHEDLFIAQAVRKSQKPVILVVNKIDPGQDDASLYEYFSLGFGDPIPIAALHGKNINALIDEISSKVALPDEADFSDERFLRVGIVGRPNTGKTSLLNKLLGSEKHAIVDDTAGTTRDFISREIELDGKRFFLIDTPGMAKGRKKHTLIEHINFKRTMKLLGNIDLAIFLVDSTAGLTEGDVKIACMIKESSCCCIILLNKWDIAQEREELLRYWKNIFDGKLQFLKWAPFLAISAKTGIRIDKLKKLLIHTINIYNQKTDNEELNTKWKEVFAKGYFSYRKRNIRLFRIEQIKSGPIVFKIRTNYPELIHFSMQRRIENWLRKNYDFQGVQLHLKFAK